MQQTGPARWRQMLAALAAVVIVLITVDQSQTGFRMVGIDVWPRYLSGVLASEGRSPYDDAEVIRREQAAHTGHALTVFDAPPMIGGFRLVASRSVQVVGLLLFMASMAAVALLVAVLTPGAGWLVRLTAAAAVLVFAPVRHTLILGQIDLICLVPVIIAVGRARRGRTTGELAPLVLLKPQTILLTSVTMAVQGLRRAPKRSIIGATIVVLGLLLAAAVLAPSATWPDWIHAVRNRPPNTGGNVPLLLLVAGVGALNGAVQLWRARRAGAVLDALLVAAAANSLLAGFGGWNPQWHVGLVLPLGSLLLSMAAGRITLPKAHIVGLAGIVGLSLADAWAPLAQFGYWSDEAGLVTVALLAAVVVLLDLVPPIVAVPMALLAATIIRADIGVPGRQLLPIAVAGVLLHLVVVHRVRAPSSPVRFAT